MSLCGFESRRRESFAAEEERGNHARKDDLNIDQQVLLIVVAFAPIIAAVSHSLAFSAVLIGAPVLSWNYSKKFLGKLAPGLVVSLTIVGIWLGSLAVLWILGLPSFFGC